MSDNLLAFDKLPAEVQAKLIEWQTPGDDRFVFVPRLPVYFWLAIAAGLGWCVYLFVSTENYLWETWQYGLFLAGSLVFIPLALFAVYQAVAAKFARLKNGYVFTRGECIKTDGNRVEFWSLKELEGFQFREDIKIIEIWIGDRLEKIKAESASDAAALERVFVEWRNAAPEKSFLSALAKPETAYSGSLKLAATAGAAVALVAVSFGVSFAAKTMNRDYDDARTWKRLENGTTVADFEEYKQRHPAGRFAAEADRKMAEIFGKLKDEYAKKVKPAADPSAVDALSQLLETAGKIPNRTIYVRINETRELDDAVVKKMKQVTGFPISNYDYSIPATEVAFRKDKLLQDLGMVFLPATRSGSMNFELTDDPPANCATIDVKYFARSVENFYRYNWYSNGSITTFYNPAAKFEFELTLKSPDARELYKTSYVSLFSNLGSTGLVDSRDAANYSFDKMYFSSVSDDFSKYLGRQFGFIE
ncbi:MAG TPA: hypothetical protein VIL74_20290 [Pyrinomonadaceae bacterium]|jgi:hypothetical protein